MFKFIMSGFVVVLIDGIPCGISMGMQGFNFRSIGQPVSENNVRASQEGFTEPLRINMTMVRRRIKSPNLCFKILSLGETSKTDICLMYMTDKVSINLLNNIEKKLKNIKIDLLLNSGYIIPFLEGKPYSIFSDVGTTERPDTLCAKINEGRIAIVIDGTPYAIIVPYLFTENFQTMDDYSHKAVYGSFIRILKYLAFFISILLPGIYVAISTFHPELLPHSLLFNIVAAEETTPFPLFVEALILHIMYEIMREAGLRLPKVVGHAVSIVGALVIGDAVVSAGLVGSPIVLIVALTAITSFVVPSLYQQIAILRLLFIIMGGTTGLFGIALLFMLTLINACSIGSMGMPYTSPIAPFSLKSMRDTFIRSGFNILNNKGVKLQDLEGSKIDDLKL
ncbi:MAG: spore germination protein [Oscillospiraceae bacterium]